MRILVLSSFLVVTACSSQQPQNEPQAANAAAVLGAANGMRGPERASSADALAAKKLVERYYALIADRKFAAARLLWGNDGADVGGDAATFAKTITRYSVYQPKVGSPTEIKVADGMQYVNVAATLHVRLRDTKAEADRTGVVMLYRSIDPNDKKAGKRDWKIRGIDIRVHD